MSHTHHHHPHAAARAAARPAPPASLLRLSALARLGLVLPVAVLLWVAALWVIGGSAP